MWPSWEITLLVFAAAFLEGAAGIDFGLLATPALGALIGVRDAVLTLSLPNLILMAIRAIGGGVPTPSIKRLMPFLGAGAAGAAVGALTLISNPPIFLKWSVGILVLLFASYSISRIRFQLDMRDETFFTYLAGFFAGGLSSFSYAGNPISIIYLHSTGAGRARMMRLAYTGALVFASVQITILSSSGAMGALESARSAVSILPAVAGFLLGRLLRGRIPPALGFTAGLFLMIAAALALLVFGPSGWK